MTENGPHSSPSKWQVVGDSIDPYLTYRLIEPDYEVWNKIQIRQRCVENWKETILTDYHLQENRCMNCHAFGNQNPNLSMVYVRGEGGGAILNRNGKLRKLNLKTANMVSSSVYYGFDRFGQIPHVFYQHHHPSASMPTPTSGWRYMIRRVMCMLPTSTTTSSFHRRSPATAQNSRPSLPSRLTADTSTIA